MALTTHEKIRKEAGFQSMFIREAFQNSPNGSAVSFYVNSDDNIKFVPEFSTGGTVAGVSDIKVYIGLSGIYGSSQLGVSGIDIDQGAVMLKVIPPSGASLTISYSSSAISSEDIEVIRLQAESMVNQRLSLCYAMPLSPIPSSVTSLATRLAAALLLIRGYGTGARDTSEDGYMLYEKLMGRNQDVAGSGSPQGSAAVVYVGEIGMICTPNYQLVDDSGVIIPRTDDGLNDTDSTFVSGGRVRGRLYDITEEEFRYKDWQLDVNKDQPGSAKFRNDFPNP